MANSLTPLSFEVASFIPFLARLSIFSSIFTLSTNVSSNVSLSATESNVDSIVPPLLGIGLLIESGKTKLQHKRENKR